MTQSPSGTGANKLKFLFFPHSLLVTMSKSSVFTHK